MPQASRHFKMKVCLVGDEGAGKTSLLNRAAHDVFNDRYHRTIGTGTAKKRFVLSGASGEKALVDMIIWDIMGSHAHRHILQQAYFDGADGALAVCDVARPPTLANLDEWFDMAREVAGDIPIYVAANKADLDPEAGLSREDLVAFAGEDAYLFTSAKSGANVERAFAVVAEAVLRIRGYERLVEGSRGEFLSDIVDILME